MMKFMSNLRKVLSLTNLAKTKMYYWKTKSVHYLILQYKIDLFFSCNDNMFIILLLTRPNQATATFLMSVVFQFDTKVK